MLKKSNSLIRSIRNLKRDALWKSGLLYNEHMARLAILEKYGDGLFQPGTSLYVSGTPLYIEAFASNKENIPFVLSADGKARTSDYILCARAEEQKMKGAGFTAGTDTIDELSESIKAALDAEEWKRVRTLFSRLFSNRPAEAEEAWAELWKTVDSDKEKYAELERALLSLDIKRTRNIMFNTLSEGGLPLNSLTQGLAAVAEQISSLDIRQDIKAKMYKELDSLYEYCKKHSDSINEFVSYTDWEKRYEHVKAEEMGVERTRFDEIMRREVGKAFDKNGYEPEVILIAKEDLDEHIRQSIESAPEELTPFLTRFFKNLKDCLEKTDREISAETLDNDDSNRVPFILHSTVFSNPAADSWEASFTVSDGKNCWCESARMSKDGGVSISSASINALGVIEELNTVREDDVSIEVAAETHAQEETRAAAEKTPNKKVEKQQAEQGREDRSRSAKEENKEEEQSNGFVGYGMFEL